MRAAPDELFRALADPTRRAIYEHLVSGGEQTVRALTDRAGVSQPAVSKHLGVLADAGLISRERRGRVIWCKLEPDAMRTALVWMQGFGQFEPLDLDAFEKFLAIELGPEPGEATSETVTAGNATA